MFPWSGRQKVLRKLFVSSKNARFYLMCRQPNLHKLARKFDARNLCKKLVQVSCTSVLTVCHQHNNLPDAACMMGNKSNKSWTEKFPVLTCIICNMDALEKEKNWNAVF